MAKPITHTNRLIARIAAFAGMAALAMTLSLCVLPGQVGAPAAHADCNQRYCGDMPEWYQYCSDRTPGQHLTGKTSSSPKYYYKTAIASSGGVDCKYMHAGFAGMWPVESTEHHSWQQVCRDLRLGNNAVWDGKYPHCKR